MTAAGHVESLEAQLDAAERRVARAQEAVRPDHQHGAAMQRVFGDLAAYIAEARNDGRRQEDPAETRRLKAEAAARLGADDIEVDFIQATHPARGIRLRDRRSGRELEAARQHLHAVKLERDRVADELARSEGRVEAGRIREALAGDDPVVIRAALKLDPGPPPALRSDDLRLPG